MSHQHSDDQATCNPHAPRFLVVSGGTGCNAICSAFDAACYVLPVSDDGGSSSEIIRVLGGPSIGDIRSRLIRLIPDAPAGSPADAIRALLAHRFSARTTEAVARAEWRDIVEGRSPLWANIPPDRKETIRGFLVYFETELLRRAQKNFSFVNGSVGNYFLSAAQMFFRSLPSAIFLFASITSSQARILPVIVTNHTVTMAAELESGEHIYGQCEISHPVGGRPPGVAGELTPLAASTPLPGLGLGLSDPLDEASTACAANAAFEASAKDRVPPLPARIARIFIMNSLGQEIHPPPNPEYVAALGAYDALVYSCGSLWTSIMPTLCLKGVADAIAGSRSLKTKILLLNGVNDRETEGYTALDYVDAIERTLNEKRNEPTHRAQRDGPHPYITHVVHIAQGQVAVDEHALRGMGIRCFSVDAPSGKFDAERVRWAMSHILERS